MAETFISLGANLGDREAYLIQALRSLTSRENRLGCLSSMYETAPVGNEEQPDFLNMVAQVFSTLPPLEFLSYLQAIEQKLGRVRHEPWGPRTIDLDLLCFGDQIWCDSQLTLPHPRLHRRRFVLVPFAEIAADFFVTGLEATVQELLRMCKDPHAVRLHRSAKSVQRRLRKARE